LLSEPLPTGVAQGVSLTATELRQMIQVYYKARGWHESGFVSEEKRQELNLLGNEYTRPGGDRGSRLRCGHPSTNSG